MASQARSRQQYARQQGNRTTPPNNPITRPPILIFHGCGCTYLEPTSYQRPLDSTRLLHIESLPCPPPPLQTSRHHHHHQTYSPRPSTRKLHISGHCRIHEFVQFTIVETHIIQTEQPRLLEAESNKDHAEYDRIRDDWTRRLDGMAKKLTGRWAGVRVCFAETRSTLAFDVGAGFTDEERRLHEGGEVGELFYV